MSMMYQIIIHLVLIALIFLLFFAAASARVNSRDIKQQVLEKQFALMIDSASSGMTIEISRVNMNGIINNIEVKDGKVFVYVSGLVISKGYPFFTKYNVELNNDKDNFYIKIK